MIIRNKDKLDMTNTNHDERIKRNSNDKKEFRINSQVRQVDGLIAIILGINLRESSLIIMRSSSISPYSYFRSPILDSKLLNILFPIQ